jgi:23S rRNA (guanosine2251-2'-O)-methyltransferase
MRIFGKRPVFERLISNPGSIISIFIESGSSNSEIADLAKKERVPIEKIYPKRFSKMSRGVNSQGVIANIGEYKYADFSKILYADDEKKPILVFLDGVTDTQNLGSMIRSLACLGGFCIVLPSKGSVSVNETVLRVASGGENYISVCRESSLSNALQRAKKEGYWIGAAVAEGGINIRKAKLNFPLAVIFGSEGKGMRPVLEKYVDYKLTIPMKGAGLSFNVAVAAAVFCYELSAIRAENNCFAHF